MTTYAVTVLGADRPGIVADTTALLAGLGLNLEDSSMTLLRGHFAMTLVCAGGAEPDDVDSTLAALRERGLAVSVRELPTAPAAADLGTPWVLTVHGGDRPAIVSRVIREVAAVGGNVTDLVTRLSGDLYLLVAELDLPVGVDATALREAVAAVAADLGVVATLRPGDVDEL